jgi:peptidyl-tRNA hydrolase
MGATSKQRYVRLWVFNSSGKRAGMVMNEFRLEFVAALLVEDDLEALSLRSVESTLSSHAD